MKRVHTLCNITWFNAACLCNLWLTGSKGIQHWVINCITNVLGLFLLLLIFCVVILKNFVFGLMLIPSVVSQYNLRSTLLSDGGAQELGHISDSCVKQLNQSNTVQMLSFSTEQEIKMQRTFHFTDRNYHLNCMYIRHLEGLKWMKQHRYFFKTWLPAAETTSDILGCWQK